MDTHGVVFDIQRYSIHDGPGIRTTVFLKGCPLRCPWCHNPEGQEDAPELLLAPGLCIRCGACLEACPNQAAGVAAEAPAVAVAMEAPALGVGAAAQGPGAVVEVPAPGVAAEAPDASAQCTRCGACVEACVSGARRMAGASLTVADVLAAVDKDRVFYVESGGGVTFSGGEPLLQAAFLRACLEGSRERGHHTVVDTCGHAPTRELLDVAAAVDLFLFDLKLMDDARHRELLGVSNRLILDNVRALGRRGAAMWLRVPLLPGVNDDQDNLEATARFARSLGSVAQVNLLPYHRTGSEKYRRLGRPDAMESRPEPAPERVAEVVAFLSKQGLNVKVGG